MINSTARSKHCIAVRPGNRQPRVNVVISWMEERVGGRTVASAGGKIERRIVVVYGVQGIEDVVAHARSDRQVRRYLPLFLDVCKIFGLTLPNQRKYCRVRSRAGLVV